MTWFETQQAYDYVTHVEAAMEEWALTRQKMQVEKAQLSRLHFKLNQDIARNSQSAKGVFVQELCDRIQECLDCIAERLKS